MSDRATRRHEGAHVAAALWFGGRPIKCVRVDEPEVGTAGKVDLGRDREFEAVDLITHLVGWMADGTHPGTWPPQWPVREDELDAVGKLVRLLGLDEEAYLALVGLAERLLSDPNFQRLAGLISRALADAPVLDTESVEILRKAAGVPDPTEGAIQCST